MHHRLPDESILLEARHRSPKPIDDPLRNKDAVYIAQNADARAYKFFMLRRDDARSGSNRSKGAEYVLSIQGKLQDPSIFEVLCVVFGFQKESMKCQLDNAKSILGSRISRLPTTNLTGVSTDELSLTLLRDYRNELLSNYRSWCDFMGIAPVRLSDSTDPDNPGSGPFGNDEDGIGAAMEVALFLLIWGEASNLRFCPEFLTWLYHKLASQLVINIRDLNLSSFVFSSFLDEVIRPAYSVLAEQLSDIGHGPVNHAKAKQYDDFNEMFWRSRCLELDVKNAFHENKSGMFNKSFIERQSWLHVLFIFWRVHTFHIVTLHILIVLARIDLGVEGAGSMRDICTPIFTLYICQVAREVYCMICNVILAVKHGCGFFDTFGGCIRAAWRFAFLIVLYILYKNGGKGFWRFALLSFAFALWEEILLRIFPIVYKYNPSRAQLNCFSRGHPFRSWLALIMTLFTDFSSLRVYTTGVLKNPPSTLRLISYVCFWALILISKFAFGYYAVIRKLYEASISMYNTDTDENEFDLIVISVNDPHNIGIISAMWIGSVSIYFLDTHIWYILWANVFAMFGGLMRRVGEVSTMEDVVLAFSRAHKRMLQYMKTTKLDKHVKFAYIWNEIIHSMRNEDILNDKEAESLVYFIVTLGPSVTFDSHDEEQRGTESFYRDIPLLPCFLFAGAIGRLIKDMKEYATYHSDTITELKRLEQLVKSMGQSNKDDVEPGKPMSTIGRARLEENEAKLAKVRTKLATEQARWVANEFNDESSLQAVQQAFLGVFLMLDGLLGNSSVSMAMGKLYRTFFGIPDEEKGYKKRAEDKISEIFSCSMLTILRKRILLYNLHLIPEAIDKLATLAEALGSDKVQLTDIPELYKAVRGSLTKVFDCGSEGASASDIYEIEARTLVTGIKVSLADATDISVNGAENLVLKHGPLLKRLARILKEPASSIPGHVGGDEAKRRIKFFINTLFMDKPMPQRTGSMPSWSTLTPYYNEEVIFPLSQLRQQTEDGVTTLEYLRTIFPLEWDAFLERVSRDYGAGDEVVSHLKNLIYSDEAAENRKEKFERFATALKRGKAARSRWHTLLDHVPQVAELQEEAVKHEAGKLLMELQLWASNRSQTLARTVRGLMYHAHAVRLLAVVEGDGGLGGIGAKSHRRTEFTIAAYYPRVDPGSVSWINTAPLAELKYRYVVSCQIYGSMAAGTEGNTVKQKERNKQKAKDIAQLARDYRGLCIAYVDSSKGRFYSVLLKWGVLNQSGEEGMVEIYRIELPGKIIVGEGKPNNQNHAMIFTSGEAVQAIDMNQDGYLEEALKQREMLEEFEFGVRRINILGHRSTEAPNTGRIVGFREHVFTQDVCSIANFFSLQEIGFVTATQRVLDEPLSVRFHYGHPDVFDRTSAITMGGISRPSKGIHLSEDIFAGFYWVLRGGRSSQLDYIQAGKGRDVGVSQITGFTAKISMGNGMQARSREVSRLAQQLDFFRLLSFYFSSVGGFLTQCFLVLSVFLYMYSKLFIAFDPRSVELINGTANEVYLALSTQFSLQLGFLIILPIPMVVGVEHGFAVAASTLIDVLFRLSPFFFVFGAGTNSYYVNAAITQGAAHYKATGRGFVIQHENFLQGFKTYLHSHYLPAFELLILLAIYAKFTILSNYWFETISVYLLVIGWLYAPLMFNPNGLDNQAVISDLRQWLTWLFSVVEDEEEGWLAWYSKRTDTVYAECQPRKKVEITIMNLRYLLLSWGFLKALEADREARGEMYGDVDNLGITMLVIVAVFFLLALPFNAEHLRKHKTYHHSAKRRFQRILALAISVSIVVTVAILSLTGVATIGQMIYTFCAFACILYFIVLTVILFVPNALRRISAAQSTLRFLAFTLGLLLQAPAFLLSLFPFMDDIQTRMNFNSSFSSRFAVAKIFAQEGRRKELKKKSD